MEGLEDWIKLGILLGGILALILTLLVTGDKDSNRYWAKLNKKSKLTCAGCLRPEGVLLLEKKQVKRAVRKLGYGYSWELHEGLCEECYQRSARIRLLEKQNLQPLLWDEDD